MDLVQGSKAIWVLMQHSSSSGESKLLPACTLPLTGAQVVNRIITNLGVFEPAQTHFRVVELAPGVTRDMVKRATAAPIDWGLQA